MKKKHFTSQMFKFVLIEDIQKDILKQDKSKTSQHSDIPIKIIKESVDIFADFLCTSINSSFKSSLFRCDSFTQEK